MTNKDDQDQNQQPDGEDLREVSLKAGKEALKDVTPGRLSLEERERMRQILGVDPGGDVAIHTGPQAAAAAASLEAKAFTLGGKDVFFKEGAYQPDTQEGQALLAHELTHVMEDVSGFSRDEPPADNERAASEGRAEQAEAAALEVGRAVSAMKLSAIQKTELVNKVVKVLKKQDRSSRERRGS